MVVTVARTPRSVTVTVSQCHSWFGSQLVVRSRSLSSAVVRWQGERKEGGRREKNVSLERATYNGRPSTPHTQRSAVSAQLVSDKLTAGEVHRVAEK